MEKIVNFLMEILPTSLADWLSEHVLAKILKKVKSKPLRLFLTLLLAISVFAIGIGAALLIIFGIMMVFMQL